MTPPPSHRPLSGWGRYPIFDCLAHTPQDTPPTQHISRGGGTAIGDAALFPFGIIDTTSLNQILDFNTTTGQITVQSGTPLSTIHHTILPKGWRLPVIPATLHATTGGCFATNCHGTNQSNTGDFAEHVTNFTLRLADNSTRTLTPDHPAFWATANGMGMTGLIETLTLQLIPLPSLTLETTHRRAPNLTAMLELFKHNDVEYHYAWINHLSTDTNLGEGLFIQANHITQEAGGTSNFTPFAPRFAIPQIFPTSLLRPFLLRRLYKRRLQKYTEATTTRLIPYLDFFHHTDRHPGLSNLYGRNGMISFHCLILDSRKQSEHLTQLLKLPHTQKLFSPHVLLKRHRKSKALLGPAHDGISLSMDFAASPRSIALLQNLNNYATAIGAHIFLQRDVTLTAEAFAILHKDSLPAWRKQLMTLDPEGHFCSLMSLRLEFR